MGQFKKNLSNVVIKSIDQMSNRLINNHRKNAFELKDFIENNIEFQLLFKIFNYPYSNIPNTINIYWIELMIKNKKNYHLVYITDNFYKIHTAFCKKNKKHYSYFNNQIDKEDKFRLILNQLLSI